jgi:HEXXH motif-containing protein
MPDSAVDLSAAGLIGDQLVTADFVPDALTALLSSYSSQLNAATAWRCRAIVADRTGCEPLEHQLSRLAGPLESSTWTLPGIAFAFHVGLRDTDADERYLTHVIAELDAVATQPEAGFRLDAKAEDDPWVKYALDSFVQARRRDGFDLTLATVPGDAHRRQTLRDSLELLREAWSEAGDAVTALVRQIVWFETRAGSGPRSGLIAQAFGAIFVAGDSDPVELIGSLVHETTHLDVIMRLAVDKLILNRAAQADSPFRVKPRPLIRVLHAAIVAARVSEAYDRCAAKLQDGNRERYEQEAATARRQLAEALSGLRATAECTPRGDALLARLEKLVG